MASNGTPQSYLAKQRNQNDNYRDRSMEQSNTNSGNPYNYGPPSNRYIPPTFNPSTGQWNTNGEQYMTPGAWSGSNGQQLPQFMPNFYSPTGLAPGGPGAPAPAGGPPTQAGPPDTTQPSAPTVAPSTTNGSKPFIPHLASSGLPPTAVPAQTPNPTMGGAGNSAQGSFGYNGLGALSPTAIPASALPQTAQPQNPVDQAAMTQALQMYGAGGLSQGSSGFMPLTRQLVR